MSNQDSAHLRRSMTTLPNQQAETSSTTTQQNRHGHKAGHASESRFRLFLTRPKRAWLRVCVSLLAWPGSMMALQSLDRLPTPDARFQCASWRAILKAPRQSKFMLIAETQSGWPRYVVAERLERRHAALLDVTHSPVMVPGCKSARHNSAHEAVAFTSRFVFANR